MLRHILLILLIAGTVFTNGCIQREEPKGTNETNVLESVEVREYEGEKLSSINSFRENSIKGPQHIDKENYVLKISGLVGNPKNYSYDAVINEHQHYKKVIKLDCVEGWDVNILWEGVLVSDLIEQAKPLSNARVIIFHAYDGYTTSFPIDYIKNKNIIIAHKMNNLTLSPERGLPFQLVSESKWGYKWIKWITEIELSDDVNYKGYWESRGYSKGGDLDESFLER